MNPGQGFRTQGRGGFALFLSSLGGAAFLLYHGVEEPLMRRWSQKRE